MFYLASTHDSTRPKIMQLNVIWISFMVTIGQQQKKQYKERTNQTHQRSKGKVSPQDFRLVLPGRIYHTHSASIRRRSLSRSSCSFTVFLILRIRFLRKNRITLSDLSHPQVTNASQYQENMGLFQASPTKPNQFIPEIASTNPFQSSLVSPKSPDGEKSRKPNPWTKPPTTKPPNENRQKKPSGPQLSVGFYPPNIFDIVGSKSLDNKLDPTKSV
jgi:hypothetical protein